MSVRMPVTFIAHGAPPLLDIPTWVSELHEWATTMPRPKAVLMISAHWEARPVTLGATTQVPLVYNLRAVDWSGQAATPTWARDLDQWTHEVLDKRDMDALMDYDRKAPGLQMALPTREHFVPFW